LKSKTPGGVILSVNEKTLQVLQGFRDNQKDCNLTAPSLA